MSAPIQSNWHEANQRYLARAIAEVRAALEAHLRGEAPAAQQEAPPPVSHAPALETLCSAFELSTFERKVLLMCAGVEMDSRFAELYRWSGAPPTFGLALAAFDDAHWSALTPGRPLRYWQLIELRPGETLAARPLAIDERILHYLAGVPALEERLAVFIAPAPAPPSMVPSHRALAEAVADCWSHGESGASLPVVELDGPERAAKRTIASHAAAMLGLRLHILPAWRLPQTAPEAEAILRLWEREAVLVASALLIECEDSDPRDPLVSLVESVRGPLLVSTPGPWRSVGRRVARFEVAKPTSREQTGLWRAALPEFNGHVDALAGQFNLDAEAIEAAARRSSALAADLPQVLWDRCRALARPRLEGLAQRIEPAAQWDDLVLPARQKEVLQQVAAHVRQRAKVYGEWGFETKGARGLGISALFAGPSGTGKTMAAEVLANALRLDLFLIDLSQVVSKYIGETEKNLRRVFDAASEGAALLLFDEADALFGKRTEVKDSHDRYANIEVSYLLQRMESYRGLAILTTNRKSAIDQAFLRRIRFIVEFPFPDAQERAEIWRRIFPQATPTEGLRIDRLARLNAAGGNIRNIAMGAAFLAADAGEPVRMAHVLAATRLEFAKIEKPLSDGEVAGWL
jgi:hypothetical protein